MKITRKFISASFLCMFVSLVWAEKTPIFANHVKFYDFVTEAEIAECSKLAGVFNKKYSLSRLFCLQAYAEYKIARQMSNHDEKQGLAKFNNKKDTRLIYQRRFQLEKNDFRAAGGSYGDRSIFNLFRNKMLKNEARHYHRFRGAFKRMYEG